MNIGWIKLHRKIQKSWIYQNADYFKAWATILMNVNVDPETVMINGIPCLCNRGEKLYSLTTWASKFGNPWNKMKVYRFFERLERETMIVTKFERGALRLTVLNYDVYQGVCDDDCNDSETPTVTDIKSNKNIIYNISPTDENQQGNLFPDEFLPPPDQTIPGGDSASVLPFSEFWDMYDYKKERKKCEKIYAKLSEDVRAIIKAKLPLYMNATPDINFRKYPQTWLRGECWNDEIKANKQQPNRQAVQKRAGRNFTTPNQSVFEETWNK